LRDEDGLETVTQAQLPLQPAHNAEQADAALRTSLTMMPARVRTANLWRTVPELVGHGLQGRLDGFDSRPR
jgi:hypothetical protein